MCEEVQGQKHKQQKPEKLPCNRNRLLKHRKMQESLVTQVVLNQLHQYHHMGYTHSLSATQLATLGMRPVPIPQDAEAARLMTQISCNPLRPLRKCHRSAVPWGCQHPQPTCSRSRQLSHDMIMNALQQDSSSDRRLQEAHQHWPQTHSTSR